MTKEQYLAVAAVILDDNAPNESIAPTDILQLLSDIYDYTDQEVLRALPPLEYSAQLYQSGTAAPQPQNPQVDTILQGFSSDADYREIVFARTAVGTYTLRVVFKTPGFVNAEKVAVLFGDAAVRITGKTNGSASGLQYIQYTFKTFTPAGAEADGVLLGNNGTFVNVKIYN